MTVGLSGFFKRCREPAFTGSTKCTIKGGWSHSFVSLVFPKLNVKVYGGYAHAHIQLLTKKTTTKKHDLGPSSFLFKLLDGADGVYGWLHPEVSDRRRDTPKDNERNDHLEKSDDESELRLGV